MSQTKMDSMTLFAAGKITHYGEMWCQLVSVRKDLLIMGFVLVLGDDTGFPSWLSDKEFTYQCRRHSFNP